MLSTEPEPPIERRPMTLDEWLALDEDEAGELVDGFLEEGEMPSFVHETLVAALCALLHAWGASRGARVVGSGVKYVLTPRRGRMPDVSVFLAGQRPPPREGGVAVPPSIAIEIVTPSPRDERRDRVEKMGEYAAFGVAGYWLVDPALRTVEIFERLPDARYAHAATASDGVIDPVPGCEGLTLDVDALWKEIDSLPREEPEATEPTEG